MAIPFKKYGYTINPITDEIETPQIFLVNKRLKKIGELYPVENLRITVNEINQPDEVSFTYYKEINGEKSPYFNDIDDLSVIQVGGFGFFECSIGKNHNSSVLKTVTAKSLGYAELSQTLHTLEVNTEDDMKRSDYDMDYPTIFYREIPVGTDEETARKLRESSLFHRILTEAPNYKIGYVDTTLWYVQRTFSWSDTDIVSIFNEVEKEIGCIFDIQVRVGDDGEVERIVNAYDMQYCYHCWEEAKISGEKATSSTSKFRNIVNGVCQNCGESKYVKDIGEDSGIYISTDNLSDDISINCDSDSIKNCFKITGGDDIMTATVQGLNMSASSKIIAFSDLQKKAMSPELKEKLDTYNSDYKNNIDDYESLLETEYNMQDIRLYLQSGKMPQIEKEIKTTDEALYSVLSNIEKHFNAKFFISSYNNYYKYPTSSARTSISNMFTTFMPEGFSMTIDKSNNEEDVPGKVFDPNAIYGWYGTVKVYSTGNRDDSYTLHITKSNGTYVTSGTSEEHYISSDASIQSMVDNFRIQFYFADQTQEEYKKYLEQYTAYLLSTVDLTYENEQKKEWDKYGYNLLKSYADGYQKCIEIIDDMLSTADGESQKILNETREKYVSIQSDILLQMNVLEDQIFAICRYLGGSYDDSYLNDNGEISYNYKYYKDDKKATIQEIFDHMINPDYVGGYNDDQTVYTPNEYIGDKPFKCLKCNSSNVAVSTEGNVCRNNGCGAKGSDIYTYRDMMENIADSYREHSNSGKTIVELRTDYRNQFDMKTYLGDTLYIELRSFIREDVYNNSNFTSDGLSNAQIIEQAKELKAKAEQELAKACNPQYSVTTSLSSVVAQKEFVYKGVKVNDDYSKFMINNYVRVLIDEELYKMRLTSITFQFPVTDKIDVTFSNVTNCKTNTAMNVKEILDSAASMATSYDYVATQADKGAVANDQFVDIMNEGLNASLMAVKNSRDQDVVIDSHGILLRKKIHEADEYSQKQMKLINRNLVMTDDNWNTAKLAIGLGLYDGVERYGVWADVICGNLIAGEKLVISNDDGKGNHTVIINGEGIDILNGSFKVSKPNGCTVTIDPLGIYGENSDVFSITNSSNERIIGIDSNGDGTFNGHIIAKSLELGANKIPTTNISGLSTVATSGNYSDLGNKPDLTVYATTTSVNDALKNYAKSGDLEAYLKTSDLSTKLNGLNVAYRGDVITTQTIDSSTGLITTTNKYKDSSGVTHEYTTYTYEDSDYVLLNRTNQWGSGNTLVKIEKDGLLTAKNAVIYGTIYATDGEFTGKITANGSFTTYNSDKSTSTKIDSGTINISSTAVGTQGIIITDGSNDKAIIRGNYLDFSYNSTHRRTAIGFIDADSNETGFYLINGNNTISGYLKMEKNSNTSTLLCDSITTNGSVTTNGIIYSNKAIILENNQYLLGNFFAPDKTRLATIGRSYGINSNGPYSNIWIGHYDKNYSGYTNNILFSSAAVTSYGTLYIPNSPVITSDARQKTDISNLDISFKDVENFILNLNPVKYKLKDGTSGRYHYGFIAQEVEKNMNKTIGDAGIITKSPISIETDDNFKFVDLDDDSTFTYGLRYEEFISPIVLLLQKQHKQIIELKNRISELEK